MKQSMYFVGCSTFEFVLYFFFKVVDFCIMFILYYTQDGPFVKLKMGCELSVYVDSDLPTHCFNPCGHMSSKNTSK